MADEQQQEGEPGPAIKIDSENVLAREVEGEIVILDLKRQHYIGGNPSVTVMWPLLEEGTTREALLDKLCSSFEVERETADRDLATFLGSLEEFGLLEGFGEAAPASEDPPPEGSAE